MTKARKTAVKKTSKVIAAKKKVKKTGVKSKAKETKKKITRSKKSERVAQEAMDELMTQWELLKTKAQGITAPKYRMSDQYRARQPITHEKLGWGFILTAQNNRLEVLFRDGIRILVANYQKN